MLTEKELQRLGGELVARDVVCCVSQLVDAKFGSDDEWQNDLGAAISDAVDTECDLRTAELREEQGDRNRAEPEDDTEQAIQDAADDVDLDVAQEEWRDQRRETCTPLEYWVVSDWLARQLSARGEVVISDYYGLTIWGRQTSGQAIAIDYVIRQIVRAMHEENEVA